MKDTLRILILSDVAADVELAVRELQRAGMSCETRMVSTEADLTRGIEEFAPAVILVGSPLSNADISAALGTARQLAPNTPFIIFTDDISGEKLEEVLKGGPGDYVQRKNPRRLPARIERALHEAGQRVHAERQERRILRLRRAMAVQRDINRAILHVRNASELFREACMIAVEQGLYRMAWVGLAKPGASKLKPLSWAGCDEGYLDDVALGLADSAEDPGIGGQVLREKQLVVVNDLLSDSRVAFRQEAAGRGYRSMVAMPLILKGEVRAVFFIYSAEPNCFDDEELQLLGALAGDISFALEYLNTADQLHQISYYDTLTGLPNRQLLHDRLEHAIARAHRRGTVFAVLFVDIDNLKQINEGLGWETGDAVLKIVANRLRSCARKSDSVAREGASQFVIVPEDQKSDDATSLTINRIVTAMSEAVVAGAHELMLTCSIGVSLFPLDGADSNSLLLNASTALSRAKRLGRNNVQFYSQDMSGRLAETLMLEGHLWRALEREELFLEYHAVVSLKTQSIVGTEALVRWQHPELGRIPPAKFIPLAEDSGMIVPIGEWVLRTACRQNKAWQDQGLSPVVVSVNLSARQFRQKDLVDVVIKVLTETGLDAKYLALELTESHVIDNWESNVAKLQQLHDMGVQICVDDFGTGYSSLSYLKRLPVSRLKLDQSFVCDVAVDESDAAIMKSVISLGHGLRLKVLAEGVETEDQLAFLRTHDCDEVQGYYFGKPKGPEAFARLLAAGGANMNNQVIEMRLVPDSQRDQYSIVRMTSTNPVMRSSGMLNCICTNCGTVLLEAVSLSQAFGFAVQCGVCSSLNAAPDDLPAAASS